MGNLFDNLGLNTAEFSPCRRYRYALFRTWGAQREGAVMFVGLNPSTADETTNDPTVRRCIGFATRWGYGGLIMTNAFAYRATDPKEMKAAAEPVGPDTDEWLKRLAPQAAAIVVAWGVHGAHRERDKAVLKVLEPWPLLCLGRTKAGQPRHPLMLRADEQPRRFLLRL
jgi:hypothetical protein